MRIITTFCLLALLGCAGIKPKPVAEYKQVGIIVWGAPRDDNYSRIAGRKVTIYANEYETIFWVKIER